MINSRMELDRNSIRSGSKNVPVLDRKTVTIESSLRENLREEGGGRAQAREAATPPPIEKESLAAKAATATARRDGPRETSPTNAIDGHHGPKETPKVQAHAKAEEKASTGIAALFALHDADPIPAVRRWQLREAYDEYGEEVIRAYAWGLKDKKERDGLIKFGMKGGSQKTLMEAYRNSGATAQQASADDKTRKVNALYRELDALGGLHFQEYGTSAPTINYVRANVEQCEKILERLKIIQEDRKKNTDMIRGNIGELLAKMAM